MTTTSAIPQAPLSSPVRGFLPHALPEPPSFAPFLGRHLPQEPAAPGLGTFSIRRTCLVAVRLARGDGGKFAPRNLCRDPNWRRASELRIFYPSSTRSPPPRPTRRPRPENKTNVTIFPNVYDSVFFALQCTG